MTPMRPDLFAARLYAILDTGYVAPAQWYATAEALLAGGADLLQLRAKDASLERRAELLEEIWPLFRDQPHRLIINDDLDLARSRPGVGLHLGQDDLPIPVARTALGPDRILGLSTHSWRQARGAWTLGSYLSYFVTGPVFATPTKPTYEPVGLELVSQVGKAGPALPWFCIGGIRRANLDTVLAAGARRVVIVSDLLQADDVAAATREARAAVVRQTAA